MAVFQVVIQLCLVPQKTAYAPVPAFSSACSFMPVLGFRVCGYKNDDDRGGTHYYYPFLLVLLLLVASL